MITVSIPIEARWGSIGVRQLGLSARASSPASAHWPSPSSPALRLRRLPRVAHPAGLREHAGLGRPRSSRLQALPPSGCGPTAGASTPGASASSIRWARNRQFSTTSPGAPSTASSRTPAPGSAEFLRSRPSSIATCAGEIPIRPRSVRARQRRRSRPRHQANCRGDWSSRRNEMPGWYIHMNVARRAVEQLTNNPGAASISGRPGPMQARW